MSVWCIGGNTLSGIVHGDIIDVCGIAGATCGATPTRPLLSDGGEGVGWDHHKVLEAGVGLLPSLRSLAGGGAGGGVVGGTPLDGDCWQGGSVFTFCSGVMFLSRICFQEVKDFSSKAGWGGALRKHIVESSDELLMRPTWPEQQANIPGS